jgi:hypothetical protein
MIAAGIRVCFELDEKDGHGSPILASRTQVRLLPVFGRCVMRSEICRILRKPTEY